MLLESPNFWEIHNSTII